MADEEHLSILRRGTVTWNQWRQSHAEIVPNLVGITLFAQHLEDTDFRDAVLRDADLKHARLTRAKLQGADFTGADLSGADLSGADLSNADPGKATLSGAI